jgi:hypothetical protein
VMLAMKTSLFGVPLFKNYLISALSAPKTSMLVYYRFFGRTLSFQLKFNFQPKFNAFMFVIAYTATVVSRWMRHDYKILNFTTLIKSFQEAPKMLFWGFGNANPPPPPPPPLVEPQNINLLPTASNYDDITCILQHWNPTCISCMATITGPPTHLYHHAIFYIIIGRWHQ